MIGFGDRCAQLNVYIDKRPNMPQWQALDSVCPLDIHQINAINLECGNGWRKVFNIYAKLVYALLPEKLPENYKSWQSYRDQQLLTQGSQCALLYLDPNPSHRTNTIETLLALSAENSIHIIMGKQFATDLANNHNASITLLDATGKMTQGFDQCSGMIPNDFSLIRFRCGIAIVCPYFDYRQLSNVKLTQLVNIIKIMRQNGYTG